MVGTGEDWCGWIDETVKLTKVMFALSVLKVTRRPKAIWVLLDA